MDPTTIYEELTRTKNSEAVAEKPLEENSETPTEVQETPTEVPETPTEVPETPTEVPETTPVGTVLNCLSLNIREAPDPSATILDVVDKDDLVLIDIRRSTDLYFYVQTSKGLLGFASRKFIEVEQ